MLPACICTVMYVLYYASHFRESLNLLQQASYNAGRSLIHLLFFFKFVLLSCIIPNSSFLTILSFHSLPCTCPLLHPLLFFSFGKARPPRDIKLIIAYQVAITLGKRQPSRSERVPKTGRGVRDSCLCSYCE